MNKCIIEDGFIICNCIHCTGTIIIKISEINCTIFRHGVFRAVWILNGNFFTKITIKHIPATSWLVTYQQLNSIFKGFVHRSYPVLRMIRRT